MIHVEMLNHKHVLAKIEVSGTQERIGVEKRNQLTYAFGVKGSARYLIHMPISPTDDPWKIEFVEQNPLFSETDLAKSSVDESVKVALQDEVSSEGLKLISCLPEGSYLICRFPDCGTITRKVQMGNIFENLDFDAMVWGKSFRLSLTAFGESRQKLPRTSPILIGLTLLHFTGCSIEDRGVWLFNPFQGECESKSKNTIAVLPLSGELVLGFFSSLEEQQKEIYQRESHQWQVEAITEIENAF